jgi:ribosomal-protein-alanine N-acetyltransferase
MTESNKHSLVRPATLADLAAMLELERQSPTAAHWTERQYHEALEFAAVGSRRLVLVAESESGTAITAFLVAQHIPPEWELENVVVAPLSRRQGMATRLIHALLKQARETDSESIFLEVRESNLAARNFYGKLGFEVAGRRKAYYAAPEEDAILYRLHLK